MLRIEKNSSKIVEAERFRTLSVEGIEVDRGQLECFVIDKTRKIEIEISNWLGNTIVL